LSVEGAQLWLAGRIACCRCSDEGQIHE
jgi:hypothetical protein